MSNFDKILAKTKKPPASENFSRNNFETVEKTTKKILNFCTGIPTITGLTGKKVIKTAIENKISRAVSLEAVARASRPNSLEYNLSYVNAFFDHCDSEQYSGTPFYSDLKEFHALDPTIKVPCAPTSIVVRNGILIPVFIVGWKNIEMTTFQRRLFVSLIERSIMTLDGFDKSPFEITFFPTQRDGKRGLETWTRGDYEQLSDVAFATQKEIFLESIVSAEAILKTRYKAGEFRDNQLPNNTDQGDLFK